MEIFKKSSWNTGNNSNTLMTSDISSGKSAIREDMQGVENSTKVLQALIDMEARELGDSGKSRIMIGGFSQGGAIALNALLRSKDKLAGCAALSTYIPGISMLLKCNSFVNRAKGREDIMNFWNLATFSDNNY